MDQDSLPPAASVSPASIDTVLKESDLLIVLCGDDTARRPEVNRELAIALKLRVEGRLSILPIIIKHGVRLPDGLDYEIQGVFLKVLFPEIVIWPLAALTAVVTLLAVAGTFLRDGKINEIDRDFQQLRAEPLPAYGSSYQRRVCELRSKAQSWSGAELGRRIDQAMSTIPRSDHAVSVLQTHPKDDPVVAVIGCGDGVVAATRKRLLWFPKAGAPRETELEITNGPLVDLREAADKDRVTYIIEHPDFADPKKSAKVERTPGEQNKYGDATLGRDGERSALTISCQLKDSKFEALVRTLSRSDDGGEWLEAEDSDKGWAKVGFRDDRAGKLKKTLLQDGFGGSKDPETKLEVTLAFDTPGHPENIYLAHITISAPHRDEEGQYFYLLAYDGSSTPRQLWMSDRYHPDADLFYIVDGGTDGMGGERIIVTSEQPKFKPIAYSPVSGMLLRHDVIVDTRKVGASATISLPDGIDFKDVISAKFDRAGLVLFLTTIDGHVIAIDATSGKVVSMVRTFGRTARFAPVGGSQPWFIHRFDEARAVSVRLDTFGLDGLVRPGRSLASETCQGPSQGSR